MKEYQIFPIFILILIMSMTGCTKKKQVTAEKNIPKKTIKQGKKDQYFIKNSGEYGYIDRADIGKNIATLDKKKFIRFDFASRVTASDIAYLGENEYFYVENETNKKAWVNSTNLVNGFVVVTKKNTPTFVQPAEDSSTEIVLQPGDVGYLVREYNGFINVDFKAYGNDGKSDDKVWVGNRWIQEGAYITDPLAVSQGLTLFTAYYYIQQNKLSEAMEFLNKANGITGDYPEITEIINRTIMSVSQKISPEKEEEPNKNSEEENG